MAQSYQLKIGNAGLIINKVLLFLPYLKLDVKEYAPEIARIMINELKPLMISDKWTWKELGEYREDLHDAIKELAILRSQNFITAKHLKEILQAIWETPWLDVGDYIIQSKILEEKSGSELKIIIKKTIEQNPTVVRDYLGGKEKAIGFLIGQVMKETKGRTNPQEAKNLIKNFLQKS